MITAPTRLDLIKMLPQGAQIAEIGVYKGWFSIEILNKCPNIAHLTCVDAWKHYEGYIDTINAEDQEANMRETYYHLRGHIPGGRVHIIRGMSLEVAKLEHMIDPLDAVYLDANHGEQPVYDDLVAWAKRLKPAGVILGHDLTENETAKRLNFGVVPAVRRFCADHGWEMTHVTAEDFASYRLERIDGWRGAEL